MSMQLELDIYLVKAVKLGFVDLDGKYLVLTNTGKEELFSIMTVCFKIINESIPSKDLITGAAKALTDVGQNVTPMELFKTILTGILQATTESQLLSFLMKEKDVDYKFIKGAAAKQFPGVSPLSIVKKDTKKYDA